MKIDPAGDTVGMSRQPAPGGPRDRRPLIPDCLAFAEVVDAAGIAGEWLPRLPQVTGPADVGIIVGRIRPLGGDVQIEGRTPLAEGRLGGAAPRNGAAGLPASR